MEILIDLLEDTFKEEIYHLKLRMIREAQKPRFEALKAIDPEIQEDFKRARRIHDHLLRIRRLRANLLTSLIEEEIDMPKHTSKGSSPKKNKKPFPGAAPPFKKKKKKK